MNAKAFALLPAHRLHATRCLLRERGCINPDQRPWTREEIRSLGRMPDKFVAERTGRSRMAVRHKRLAMKRTSISHRPWTEQDDMTLLALNDRDAAAVLKRTYAAVRCRRQKLRRGHNGAGQ